jgi:glycerophosphoryl diester phosphodiesterase
MGLRPPDFHIAAHRGALMTHPGADLSVCRVAGTEPLCRIEDVLSAFPGTSLQIEIKDPDALDPVLRLLAADPALASRAYLTCFHQEVLDGIPGLLPGLAFGWILPASAQPRLGRLDARRVPRVNAHWALVDEPEIAAYQAGGGLVSPWPCNTAEDIARAMAGPYCGLTTDHPSLAAAMREEIEARCGANA